ncbi:LysE family transporter [Desulfonema magnum]|uniref:Amino acid exporter family protein, LeuE-type n=1 Tax=Desulfonema magnum TaxID=45655 RepID=A0A975BGW4_9BACT|nr:LysE family transporter [Desulfonema magnum]QTA84999.1 Amino acid exporter family protein, LeuE-type [Desulfonema magnum]
MLNEFTNFVSVFWVIFSFSFLVALTGAMSPGPLLTYTIIKSAKATGSRGYLMGAWIILGHAILELAIIILLLSGFSFILKNIFVVRAIGVVGGLILIYFGLSIVRNVYLGNIPTDFLNSPGKQTQTSSEDSPENKGLENPVIGGIMVSMSNPYWWVWWATIGLAFMIQFEISFDSWPKLLAFFLGHEAGDLICYLLISTLAFFGLRKLDRKAYYGVLVFCGVFMILFGVYLGISPLVMKN